jgi:type I restriction enzyme S subunit
MMQQLDIPCGWLTKRLSYLIKSMDAGVSVNSEDRKADFGECGILKTSAVTSGVFDADENKAILASEVKRAKISPTCDRIIMSRMNTPALVGANAYVPQTVSNLFLPDRLWLLTPKEGRVNMRWLAFVLGSPKYRSKLSSFATGTSNSMKNITKGDVASLPVLLPSLPEQKAIADLLSTWDEAIEKTERLIQAKEANLKGQIQRIMGKEAIDANGWSMVHLGELFSEVTRKVGEKELTPYSISAGIGFVSQREKWGKDISGSQHKNYTHLKAGEFSYNKGNSKRYQQGCVYLLKGGEICVPNVFISFKPKAKNVVPEFFEHYFIADYHARELKRYITSGARSDGLGNCQASCRFFYAA